MQVIEFMSIWHLIILVGLILTAILAIESRSIVYCVISLAIMSVLLGVLFILLDAPYVGVFQIAVYAGAITILMLATISLVSQEEREVK
ncbi:MAG: NADH-quinone oxidoreductase subunit J [Promethearchaeota archaeon]